MPVCIPGISRPGDGVDRGSACMMMPGMEQVEELEDALIIRFPGRRNVISTSWLNGGYREDLTSVFNHQIPLDACNACHSGGSIEEYLRAFARDRGLDARTTTGLITRAEIKNTAVVRESYRDVSVCAIVTAGIDKNGGRAGDPASYHENGDSFEPVGGTINTVLVIGADLPPYAMARAVMTATEAKAAALQQLMARSIYSTGIATGSGTDMIAVIANPEARLHLSDAGKHSTLGELIGKTVIAATVAALGKETGLSPGSQRDALVRLQRYHVTEKELWNAAVEAEGLDPTDIKRQKRYTEYLKRWAKRPASVALVAAALHLVDEAGWGLIPPHEASRAIARILGRGNTGIAALRGKPPCQSLVFMLASLVYQQSGENPGRNPGRSHGRKPDH